MKFTTHGLTQWQEAEARLATRVHTALYQIQHHHGMHVVPCYVPLILRHVGQRAFLSCRKHGYVLFENTEVRE